MLTIAIPTCNRADKLPVLLDTVFSQLDDCKGRDINVVISDNASTDSTKFVVETYSARNPGIIFYFCNEKNLGYSSNVDLAVRRSPGDFVLLMSDDDALEDGALAKITSIIDVHGNDADLIFASALPYDMDLAVPMRVRRCDGVVRLFPDGRDYLRYTRAFPPALLSGYVVKKAAWENYGHADMHVNSIIVHMLVAMEICLSGSGVVISCAELIKYRTANILSSTTLTWGKHSLFPFIFYLDCLQGLKDSIQHCPYKLKKILYAAGIRTIVLYLIRQKVVLHPFDKKGFYDRFRSVANWCSPYTWLVYCVRITPRIMLKTCFGGLVRRYPL